MRCKSVEDSTGDLAGAIAVKLGAICKVKTMRSKRQQASDKTFRAIGRFLFEFSQLDYEIRRQVGEAAGVDLIHVHDIMTQDFGPLCTAAIKVFDFEYSGTREKLRRERMRGLLKRAQSLNNIRNVVAHGLWVPFEEGGKVIHMPRSLKLYVSNQQARTLEKQADEAKELRRQIESVVDEKPPRKRSKVWR
jgi:hypothetical protein